MKTLFLKDKLAHLDNRRRFAYQSAHEAIQYVRRSRNRGAKGLAERGLKDARFARQMAHTYQRGIRELRIQVLESKDGNPLILDEEKAPAQAHLPAAARRAMRRKEVVEAMVVV